LLASDSKEDNIAVLDPVVAPFHAKVSSSTQRFHGTCRDQLVDRGHLRADEMLFEICVDLAGRYRRGRIALAWPRADLGLARSEIGDEPSRLPDRTGDAAETRFVDAVTSTHLGLLVLLELAQLGFQPR